MSPDCGFGADTVTGFAGGGIVTFGWLLDARAEEMTAGLSEIFSDKEWDSSKLKDGISVATFSGMAFGVVSLSGWDSSSEGTTIYGDVSRLCSSCVISS